MFDLPVWIQFILVVFVYFFIGFIWACFTFGTSLADLKNEKHTIPEFYFDILLWPFCLMLILYIIFLETLDGFWIIFRMVTKQLGEFFTNLSKNESK